jgi:hypothetical protein
MAGRTATVQSVKPCWASHSFSREVSQQTHGASSNPLSQAAWCNITAERGYGVSAKTMVSHDRKGRGRRRDCASSRGRAIKPATAMQNVQSAHAIGLMWAPEGTQ